MNALPKLTLNVLLALIDKAKITGTKKTDNVKGKTGNNKILVMLLGIICCGSAIATDGTIGRETEGNILEKLINAKKGSLNSKAAISDAYAENFNRNIHNFLRGKWKKFPDEKFIDTKFEEQVEINGRNPQWGYYKSYLAWMGNFCDLILDRTKADAFVYTLLELINRDNCIDKVYYGNQFIPKNELTGNYAHPKNICIEALLLGVLYHVLKNPAQADTSDFKLLALPDRLTFYVTWLGNSCNANFMDSRPPNYTRLKASFDTTNKRDLQLAISENSHRSFAKNELHTISSEQHYPLQITSCYIDEEINLDTMIESMNINIFLYGAGGIGKTTTLIELLQRFQENTDVNTPVLLCFSLNQYEPEIRKQIRPSESCWILIHILMKYYYQNNYKTYEAMVAHEDEKEILVQLNELQTILEEKPEEVSPQYILLLDGINELSGELQDELVEELSWICEEWHNVRLIVTGRVVPQYPVFEQFKQLEIRGISDSDRDAALSGFSDYPELLKNKKLMEVLKIPLFLNMYLKEREHDFSTPLNTRGEILDAYVASYKQTAGNYDSKVVRFLVQFVLPFVAKAMANHFRIDRADLLEAVDKAYSIYLMNERIYQNVIAPLKIRKATLLESRDREDFVDLFIENTGFLEPSYRHNQCVSFTNQYFQVYFAAKYILNLIEAVETSFGTNHTIGKCRMFHKVGLGSIWFRYHGGGYEIYQLIGEICGDYYNIPNPDESFGYHGTQLDTLLDMCREFDTKCAVKNIITTMSIARNGTICKADFRKTILPESIPCNVKFSLDGKYPSDFQNCKMTSRISCYDSRLCFAAYVPDGNAVLFGLEDGYVFLWDLQQSKIVWEQNMSSFLNIDKIAFSLDRKYLTITSNCNADTTYSVVVLKVGSGSIIQNETEETIWFSKFSPDGCFWTMAWTDKIGKERIKLVNLEKNQVVPLDLQSYWNSRYIAVFSHDSKYILVVIDFERVELRTTEGVLLKQKDFEGSIFENGISFSPDASGCLINTRKNILLWDFESDTVSVVFTQDDIDDIYDAYFSPDGQYAVLKYKTETEEKYTVILHIPTGKYETLSYNDLRELTFSPDSKYFFAQIGGHILEQQVLLYDIENRKFINIGHYSAIAFSPDSKFFLAAVVMDNWALLYDIENRKSTIIRTKDWNNSDTIGFAPDSKHYIIGDTLYSITGEKELLCFREQFNHFKGCDFTGADFFSDENKEILRKMGAIVD